MYYGPRIKNGRGANGASGGSVQNKAELEGV